MNRITRATLVLGALAATLTLTAPAATAVKAPEQDSLKGTGTTSIAEVSINATNKGASPQDPAKGTFTAKGNGLDLNGPITCLHVVGNAAGLIYKVAEGSSPAPLVGRDIFVTILDNSASGKTDKMGFLPPGTTPPGGGCSPAIMMRQDLLEVTEGDFVVTDAAVATK